MAKVNVYDLSVFGNRLQKMKSAMLLLNIYIQKCDEYNRIELKKNELADVLGKSRRTITNWIIILARNGAIKYKYSGSTRLNPFFSYNGTSEDYKKAQDEWRDFKSDIAEVQA